MNIIGMDLVATLHALRQVQHGAAKFYASVEDLREKCQRLTALLEQQAAEDRFYRACVFQTAKAKKRRNDKRSQAPFVRRGAGAKRNFV